MVSSLPLTSPLAAWLTLEYYSWGTFALCLAGLSLVVVLLGVRSLAGLGRTRKWVAIGVRLGVIAMLLLILGGVRWQRQHKDLEVMFLRDVSQSAEQVEGHPGKTVQEGVVSYLNEVSKRPDKPVGDRVGVISFDNTAAIDALPNTALALGSGAIREPGSGTDVAAAIQLALATMNRDAMHRMVLLWDGNATAGDVDGAAAQATAQGVPIDVVPLAYNVRREVTIDSLVAPTWRRENEPFSIDVFLKNTNDVPVTGTLTVRHQGEPMDLDPYAPGEQTTRKVTLTAGNATNPSTNKQTVQISALKSGGVHKFRATFDPDPIAGEAGNPILADTLGQNNAAEAFTFVRGKGKILYVDNVADGAGNMLADALGREDIAIEKADHITPDQFPADLVKLQDYDAVLLANVPRGAGGLNDDQQRLLASYVHDMGGGLVMIGGPDAFGAGGWQGSRLEEVLPVDMDIPAKRNVGKGALVVIVHSCEFPNGNYWGEQCAIKAAETLSAQDEVGIITYGWQGGASGWDYPLAPKGDGTQVFAAIKGMQVGDMPSFDDSMDVALNGGKPGVKGLKDSDARQKHVIIISDGDPQVPNPQLVAAYQAAKVSVSTVSVYPHTQAPNQLPPNMKYIADNLKGKAYGPVNTNFNTLPQIFIKEATIVRRSLIHEEAAGFAVKQAPSNSDMVKGLDFGAPLYGMVLTSLKKSPQVESPLVAGKENDPVLAHWQTGLGRAAVFTPDAHNKWSAGYVGSEQFGKFWAQVVRSVARPPMSGDFDVQTTHVDGKGRITVEALNRDNAFLNFLNIRGNVLGPDGKSIDVRLVQTAPGVYTGEFDAPRQGTYAVGLRYGGNNAAGTLRSGLVVNDSPELRALRSNETILQQIADRTGGRVLPAFDASAADVFTRLGVKQTASPLPVWDLLLPFLLALLILDVAIRRIAWDWNSTKRLAAAGANYVRRYTQTTRKVETPNLFDALKQSRETATERTLEAAATVAPAKPDPTRKFEARPSAAGAADGDIADVIGGATNKPIPSAPKKIDPKGLQGDAGGGMGSLLEAKRRAREKMDRKETGEER
jgi:uncharacterized membrane protein